MTPEQRKEFARKGGKAVFAKYGSNHMSDLGSMGSRNQSKEYYSEMGKRSAELRRKKNENLP